MKTPGASVARRAKGVRRERGSISAGEILGAAARLAREVGVDGLSMPKLAEELGIGVTSIYWYFKSKDELIEKLTAEVSGQVQDSIGAIPRSSWPVYLTELFRRLRTALREDDLACDLLFMRSSRLSLETLDHIWPQLEESLQLMVDAGFTLEEALHNYFSLSHFTRGAVSLERQMRKAGLSTSALTPAPDRYPLLAEASRRHNLRGITDAAFDTGLQGIVDGLRARLKTG